MKTMDKLAAVAAKHGMPWRLGKFGTFDPVHGHHVKTCADLEHEIGHWLVAPPSRRMMLNFGLGRQASPGLGAGSLVNDQRALREERWAALIECALLYECGYPRWRLNIREHAAFNVALDMTNIRQAMRAVVRRGLVSPSTAKVLLVATVDSDG